MSLGSFLKVVLAGSAVALAPLGAVAADGAAASTAIEPAAHAINALGIDLLRLSGAGGSNTLLSPYSIQLALAMTYAGAAGVTRTEMERVLHYGEDETNTHAAFGALASALEEIQVASAAQAARAKSRGREVDAIQFSVANRLFGRKGFHFESAYLGFVADRYGAPLEPLDFKGDNAGATQRINDWVAERTHGKIPVIVPMGALSPNTALALVNAIHFKAAWETPFRPGGTRPAPFQLPVKGRVDVPMMTLERELGVARGDGFKAVALPYGDARLQLLVLLPDAADGWKQIEERLSPELLKSVGSEDRQLVNLELPRIRLTPAPISLGKPLQQLGMKSAFDLAPHGADFSRMASAESGGERIRISEVFHRTYIDVDEKGTEAAAATAVMMTPTAVAVRPRQPLVIKVDRPFLFAIQHRPSGACLFIGQVTDPR